MTAAYCAARAKEALLAEVSATPKPGLVDRRNSGAHRDMNYQTFVDSAQALEPFFDEFYMLGAVTPMMQLLPVLRVRGIAAERAMFAATGGVNTHKGALFSLGLLCAACGALTAEGTALTPDALCLFVSRLTRGITAELRSADTHGGRAYADTGATGVRGEAERGYPAVRELALPLYRKARCGGMTPNDAAVYALIGLISRVEDTNLLARGGETGAQWAKKQAAALETVFSIEKTAALDDAFIARNLSPGGCADLLAIALFLDSVCNFKISAYNDLGGTPKW